MEDGLKKGGRKEGEGEGGGKGRERRRGGEEEKVEMGKRGETSCF